MKILLSASRWAILQTGTRGTEEMSGQQEALGGGRRLGHLIVLEIWSQQLRTVLCDDRTSIFRNTLREAKMG